MPKSSDKQSCFKENTGDKLSCIWQRTTGQAEHIQTTLQETRQEAYGIGYSTEPETRDNKGIQL